MSREPGEPAVTPAGAEEIRRLYEMKLMSQPQLAEKFHCSRRTISRIIKGETYRGHPLTRPHGAP